MTTPIVWTKYTIPYTDFQVAATEKFIPIFTRGARQFIVACVYKHSQQFIGGTITDLTFAVGEPRTEDDIWNPFYGGFLGHIFDLDLTDAPSDIESFYFPNTYGNFIDTGAVSLKATAVGDNLDQLTQGSLDVWIKTIEVPNI
jgi:hypothetical protein